MTLAQQKAAAFNRPHPFAERRGDPVFWIALMSKTRLNRQAATKATMSQIEKTQDSAALNSNSVSQYREILSETVRLIKKSRQRALATVNKELVHLYWHIGRTIFQQQEHAEWGDGVVEQFASDLRLAFPDMKGFCNVLKLVDTNC